MAWSSNISFALVLSSLLVMMISAQSQPTGKFAYSSFFFFYFGTMQYNVNKLKTQKKYI
jgi:hypothetical protein